MSADENPTGADGGPDPRQAPIPDNVPQKPPTPLFLARETYRRRRIMDAARLLPALGAALVLMPVLWVPGNETGGTARGLVYLFLVWLGLIIASRLISGHVSAPLKDRGDGSDSTADTRER